MTQLSISITGADIVRRGLQDLEREIPRIGREQIYRTAQGIVRRMKEYPSSPPMSSYMRTYTLGGGWAITSNSTTGYGIRNDTPYTKYVVGNAHGLEQAWMHQGRWQLLRDVTEDEVSKLPEQVINEIEMVARRAGF